MEGGRVLTPGVEAAITEKAVMEPFVEDLYIQVQYVT